MNSGITLTPISIFIGVQIEGKDVTLVEAALDIVGLKPFLDRLFGENTFYSEFLMKLMNTPMSEINSFTRENSALRLLGEEVNAPIITI